MVNKIKYFCCAFLLVTTGACSFGQQVKYEKEYRLKNAEVPLRAKQFVDAGQIQGKIRWYFEENLKGNSVEAKFTGNGKKFSIEFDTLGNLQDIEIQINWVEIAEKTRKKITSELDSCYDSHQIDKIQIQYTGNDISLPLLLNSGIYENKYTKNYEIVVKGKKIKQVRLYEIVFNQDGGITECAEIIFKNTDNLEY